MAKGNEANDKLLARPFTFIALLTHTHNVVQSDLYLVLIAMDVSLSVKLECVRQWLSELASQHEGLQFGAWRETPASIDTLYLLYCKSKRSNQMCRRIISHTTSLAKQYQAESMYQQQQQQQQQS
jgi:hypothetical protein